MSPWMCCAWHAGVFRFWDIAVCDWAQKKAERKKIAWFSRSYVFKNIWHLTSEKLLLQKPFCICLGQSGPIYSRLKSQAWSLEGGCLYTFGQAVYSDLKCCYKYKREDVTPCQTFGNGNTSVEANQFITDIKRMSGMVLQALLVLGTISTAPLCQSSSVPVSSQFSPACPGQHRHSSAVWILSCCLYTGRVDSLYLHTNYVAYRLSYEMHVSC